MGRLLCPGIAKCLSVLRELRHIMHLISLPGRMSTVYFQIRTGHEAGRIAEQEYCSASVLPRLTQLAEHILSRPFRLSLRVLLEKLLHHGGDDIAR